MYKYFVSFVVKGLSDGHGNCEISSDELITSWDQIQDIEKQLSAFYPSYTLQIINYILLNKENK